MRKAQVTVFIIIGILLLVSVGLFYYLRSQAQLPVYPTIAEVPVALQPYKQAVTSCVEQTAKDALKAIGAHGGYITPVPASTDGAAVRFSPDSELTVANWWFLQSQDTCTGQCEFSTKRPNLYAKDGEPSIEGQVSRQVKSSYQNCLNVPGWAVQKLGDIEVSVNIAPNDVIVLVKAPVTVSKAGTEYSLNEVATVLPVNLKEMYDLATTITNLQARNRFLEKQARTLIDTFAEVNKDKLPPVSAMTFDIGPGEFWLKFDVKDKLRGLLQSYVPFLQVFGTRNYAYIRAPADVKDKKQFEVLYNRNMLIPTTEPHDSTNVRFSYLDWWEPYFDLNCNGQVCRSEDVLSTFLFIFGMQRYAFAYDVSYPVMVELENPNALNGEGYTFQFMLESNLRNNAPMPAKFEPLSFPPVGDTGSLLCDASQATVPVSITATDGKTKNPIDVPVMFTCGTETCHLGKTEQGKLETFAPRCLGGQLLAQKTEVWPTTASFDTDDGKAKKVSLTIEPFRTVQLKVKKYLAKKSGDQWILDTAAPVLAGESDTGVITFARQDGYTAAGEPGSTIDLLPGTYKVDATMLWTDRLVFPAQKRCFTTGLLGKETCYNIPTEPIVFDSRKPYPNGGSSVSWTVSSDELDSGSVLEVGVVSIAEHLIPEAERQIEDLDQIGKLKSYSDSYGYALVPKVVNS